jgi:DNA-binding MarR family transcriptional regulator
VEGSNPTNKPPSRPTTEAILDNRVVNAYFDNSLVNSAADMTNTARKTAYEITWLIRRLFRSMAQDANQRLVNLNVTAADRAVLEFLYPDKELAVPEIASRYQVSRQHVQTTANGLVAQKLVKTKINPQHKRSSLLTLTSKGRKLFASIRKDDEVALAKAFTGISASEVAITQKTLKKLQSNLTKQKPC